MSLHFLSEIRRERMWPMGPRHSQSRRPARLPTPVAVALLALLLAPSAWGAASTEQAALTVTARITLPPSPVASPSGFYLAAIGVPQAQGPAVGVAWSKVPAGWFGDLWSLQLAIAPHLAEGLAFAREGTGLLTGVRSIELRNVDPAWGHTYETRLAYDSEHGTVAVTVTDLTTGEQVYAGGADVRPHPVAQLLALAPDGRPAYDIIEARPLFAPGPVRWRLLQRSGNALLATENVNRRAETVVRLQVPWKSMPGTFQLTAVVEGRRIVLASAHGPGAALDIPVAPELLRELPAGRYPVEGAYIVDGEVVSHMAQEMTVGRVETRLTGLAVHRDGKAVAGMLEVETDGPVPQVAVDLEATFLLHLMQRDHVGVPQASRIRLADSALPVFSQSLDGSHRVPVQIPLPADVTSRSGHTEYAVDVRVVAQTPVPVHIVSEPVSATFAWQTPVFTVDPAVTYQVIDGFGASGAWWAQYVGLAEGIREDIADLLFSPTHGIGLSQYRYHAGAGIQPEIRDPWRTAETFEVDRGVYDWSRDPGGRWMLLAAKERGVEDFTLFSLSPPQRLSANGKTFADEGATSNLKPENYAEYAQYLADIIKHFDEEYGVRFSAVSPLNEPEWDWSGGGQEGSQYSLDEIIALGKVLAETLEREGLDTPLLLPEAGDWAFVYGSDRNYADALLGDPDLGPHLSLLAVHSYWSTDAHRMAAAQKMKEYPHVRLWMTEWCEMRTGRDLGMDQALNLARTIHADLTLAGVSSWQFWLAVSRHDYRDGLLYVTPDYTAYETSKAFWAMGNFSRFIRPGARRVDVQTSAPASVAYQSSTVVSAFLAPEPDQLIVVAINELTTPAPIELVIPTDAAAATLTPHITSAAHDLEPGEARTVLAEGGRIRATVQLHPQSVTTFVITLER